MSFSNAIKKLQSVEKFDLVAETTLIINQNAEVIKSLLREQLKLGKDGEGNNVTLFGRDFYKDATIFNKEHAAGLSALGRETRWVTNYLYGYFYNSLVVKTSGRVFDITSEVPYFDEILARSGDRIMKLDQNSLRTFEEQVLKPKLKERFNQVSNGL